MREPLAPVERAPARACQDSERQHQSIDHRRGQRHRRRGDLGIGHRPAFGDRRWRRGTQDGPHRCGALPVDRAGSSRDRRGPGGARHRRRRPWKNDR